MLPDGVKGLMSRKNDNPLEAINISADWTRTTIQIVNDGELIAEDGLRNIAPKTYLGAILAADGTTVIWQNDTKPLP